MVMGGRGMVGAFYGRFEAVGRVGECARLKAAPVKGSGGGECWGGVEQAEPGMAYKVSYLTYLIFYSLSLFYSYILTPVVKGRVPR